MRCNTLLAIILATLMMALPQSAMAACDWSDALTWGDCLEDIWDGIEDLVDDMEDVVDQIVEDSSNTILGMIKDIDGFLDNTESSFNTAKGQFDKISGTMLDSFTMGIDSARPVFEREYNAAKSFAECGAGTECGDFKAALSAFLVELDALTTELAYFYDSTPPDVDHVDGMLTALSDTPGYFFYPLYRALYEMNFDFAVTASDIADVTESLETLKNLNPAGALAGSGAALSYAMDYDDKLGYASPEAAFLSEDAICGYIDDNRDTVQTARYIAYAGTVLLKGIGVVLRMAGKTVQTDVEAQAFGTVGTRIRIDGTSALGVFLSGTADALFAVLGSTTTRIYFCDVSTQLIGLGDKQADVQTFLAAQHIAIEGQLTTHDTDIKEELGSLESSLTTQLDEVKEQLEWIRRCLPGNGQGQADCKYP